MRDGMVAEGRDEEVEWEWSALVGGRLEHAFARRRGQGLGDLAGYDEEGPMLPVAEGHPLGHRLGPRGRQQALPDGLAPEQVQHDGPPPPLQRPEPRAEDG